MSLLTCDNLQLFLYLCGQNLTNHKEDIQNVGYMVDKKKIMQYNLEMAEHVNGAAQYLDALFGGRFVTKEQTRDMIDYMFAGTKRNIEGCPFCHYENDLDFNFVIVSDRMYGKRNNALKFLLALADKEEAELDKK